MSTIREQLHLLAEQIAGGLVFVDVVYTVRTAGCSDEATGETAEAALARFIAEWLAALPPTNGNGHKPPTKRSTTLETQVKRETIRPLVAQGLAPAVIAERTGISLKDVYYHRSVIAKEEAPPGTPASPFRD